MQSKAATVDQYLAELPADRRAAIQTVREVILMNLDKDYEEGMSYGMIGYFVPHRIYPAGYHCDPRQPLPFINLASQKNHMAVYMMSIYGTGGEADFRAKWARSGKKLDMGKCCIRFKKVEDLALDVIGEAIRRVPARTFIEFYEKAIKRNSGKSEPTGKSGRPKTKSPKAKAVRSAKPPRTAKAKRRPRASTRRGRQES